jgi:hypothetical protein
LISVQAGISFAFPLQAAVSSVSIGDGPRKVLIVLT